MKKKIVVSDRLAVTEATAGASHHARVRKRVNTRISNNCPMRNEMDDAAAIRLSNQANDMMIAAINP